MFRGFVGMLIRQEIPGITSVGVWHFIMIVMCSPALEGPSDVMNILAPTLLRIEILFNEIHVPTSMVGALSA